MRLIIVRAEIHQTLTIPKQSDSTLQPVQGGKVMVIKVVEPQGMFMLTLNCHSFVIHYVYWNILYLTCMYLLLLQMQTKASFFYYSVMFEFSAWLQLPFVFMRLPFSSISRVAYYTNYQTQQYSVSSKNRCSNHSGSKFHLNEVKKFCARGSWVQQFIQCQRIMVQI